MKLKPTKERKYLKIGDKRTIKRFAFLPIEIIDERKWMEFVTILQEVAKFSALNGFGDEECYSAWKNVKFMTTQTLTPR